MHCFRCSFITVILFVVQYISGSYASSQTVIQLRGAEHTQDTTIFSVNTIGNSGAADGIRAGKNGQGENRRILIRFDVSAIPTQAMIVDTTLEMFVTDIPGNTAGMTTHSLHRVLQDWVEGTGTNMNGETVSGAVTWNAAKEGIEAWHSPGGTYEIAVSAQAVVPSVLQAAAVWSDVRMIADVQDWINGTTENYGWIIIGDESAARSVRGYASSEIADLAPVLHIAFNGQTAHIDSWMLFDM